MNKASIWKMKMLIKLHKFFFVIFEPKAYAGNILDLQKKISCQGSAVMIRELYGFFEINDVHMQLIVNFEQFLQMELTHPS